MSPETASPRLRRAYFECRYGQLHVHNAIPAGGGFDEQTTLVCLHASSGILAVEMQAASLFAFGAARGVPCGVVAHVTNGAGHSTADQFDKGGRGLGYEILKKMSRAGLRCLQNRSMR